MKLNYHLLIIFLLCAMSSNIYAQKIITGTILDSDTNEPLIGATVINPITKTGTVTDFDGQFSIETFNLSTFLEILLFGYQTYTLKLTNKINY